jgi:RsiW-degrading membrane proteinase PrsW (M82 family)
LLLLNNDSCQQIWIDYNRTSLRNLTRCPQFDSDENQCWTLLYNTLETKFCLTQNNCQEEHFVICENKSFISKSKKRIVFVLILLIIIILIFILFIMYYYKRRQMNKRREKLINNAILSVQDLSLLD